MGYEIRGADCEVNDSGFGMRNHSYWFILLLVMGFWLCIGS